MINGRQTDMAEFAATLQAVAGIYAAAAKKRDAVNEARKAGQSPS